MPGFVPGIHVLDEIVDGRACPGHPRLKKEVADARRKAGHDDGLGVTQ